jgi:hypothetical protein
MIAKLVRALFGSQLVGHCLRCKKPLDPLDIGASKGVCLPCRLDPGRSL